MTAKQQLTALMLAAGKGHVEFVSLLLDLAVDVNARTVDGKTAMSHADGAGHTGIVQLLKRQRQGPTKKKASGQRSALADSIDGVRIEL